MKKEVTTLRTEALYSDDGNKRYLLRKSWDESKPKLAIIMLAAGGADGIQLDTTTQLVINNTARLGYGGVSIVNLSATLNDFSLRDISDDEDNIKMILNVAKDSEKIVYAPGTGKAKNKGFLLLQERVLRALLPYEEKLCCLCNEDGEARLQHPLSPQVRLWNLCSFKIKELVNIPTNTTHYTKKKTKESKETPQET